MKIDLDRNFSKLLYKWEERWKQYISKGEGTQPRFWCHKYGGGGLTQDVKKLSKNELHKERQRIYKALKKTQWYKESYPSDLTLDIEYMIFKPEILKD